MDYYFVLRAAAFHVLFLFGMISIHTLFMLALRERVTWATVWSDWRRPAALSCVSVCVVWFVLIVAERLL